MTVQDATQTLDAPETEYSAAIRWSATLGRFVETIGKWGTLFILPLVFITMWDVLQRKVMKMVGDVMLAQNLLEARDWMYSTLLTLVPFRSTLLQELEWHCHTALFVLVLGYGYIYNRHVRVDLVREKLQFRKQAWIELLGCTLFMVPYCVVVGWFATVYALDAYAVNEQSASLVGLSNRWAIKAVLVFGLGIAAIAGIANWLQVAFALFGARDRQNFQCYTVEREEEKMQKKMLLENIDDSFSDGSNEAKRGDSSKLMSRNIDTEAFAHADDSKGQKFFYYFGFSVMIVIIMLLLHTFNFWSWLI